MLTLEHNQPRASQSLFEAKNAIYIQYPERRCKVTPLHVSIPHGTGRGWVVELLAKLVGSWNIKKTKMKAISGEDGAIYHDCLNKSLICAIEEVRESTKRFSISDQIRDLLTENALEVNIKFGAKKTQPVYTNFFFMTNHRDALALSNEDRRINVLSGPAQPRDKPYYDTLYAWLETRGVHQLHSYLMDRDLSQFNWTRSMETDARKRMIESSRSETEQLYHEFKAKMPFRVMTFRQISLEIFNLSDNPMRFEVDEKQLLKLLQQDFTRYKKIKVNGKAERPWILHSRHQDVTQEYVRKQLEETCAALNSVE